MKVVGLIFALLSRHARLILGMLFFVIVGLFIAAYPAYKNIVVLYEMQQSITIKDRHQKYIYIQPNYRGYHTRNVETIPSRLKNLLIQKEDRFFYYHLGINPFSIVRDVSQYIFSRKLEGSSTITQQLVKVLLEHEQERNLKNKIIESFYTLALELHTSKKQILTMYANTVYFGNQAQGIGEASLYYFHKPPEILTDTETLSLLATLNNPSERYPKTFENTEMMKLLAGVLDIAPDSDWAKLEMLHVPQHDDEGIRKSKTFFELNTLSLRCTSHCYLTIDQELTERLRGVLRRNLNLPSFASVENGAIVVIKLPENELLTIVGSPSPNSWDLGFQINMAIEPRPIGSTAKPFIYLKAFEKGARPYTLVEDREYKYIIGTGFPFYPKNYDGLYRGTVTLHEALSNSINVPSVKVLEYTGLENFYNFLEDTLAFKPIQPLENYELGIALGALEMDLLTLSGYFTIFPNKGILKPLIISYDASPANCLTFHSIEKKVRPQHSRCIPLPTQNGLIKERRVAEEEFVQLTNKILSDRKMGVSQFGIKSDLNLPQHNYALKTGTSRDFHDSWTIGYTPDFLVGIWIGNSKNTPMRQISGQMGAGKIWHEVMEIMLASPYNKKTPFSFDKIKEFSQSDSIEYGLHDDDYDRIRNLLLETKLILTPHDGDTYLFEQDMRIPLVAARAVSWFVSDIFLEKSSTYSWEPPAPGEYSLSAQDSTGKQEKVSISIRAEE